MDLSSTFVATYPFRLTGLKQVQKTYREMEQLVARRAHNPKVGGSSPPLATLKIKELHYFVTPFLFFPKTKRFFLCYSQNNTIGLKSIEEYLF